MGYLHELKVRSLSRRVVEGICGRWLTAERFVAYIRSSISLGLIKSNKTIDLMQKRFAYSSFSLLFPFSFICSFGGLISFSNESLDRKINSSC